MYIISHFDKLPRAFRHCLCAAVAVMGGLTAPTASAADGVNLQPSYYNNGNPNLGFSLMRQQANIRRLRIEVDSSRVSAATAKGWIDQAKANGYTDIIVTHHLYSGSDNAGDLLASANWWRSNYSSLGGGFLINLSNEWGSHNQTPSSYASAYNSAISVVRSVYSGPIVVDIPGWGQETLTALNAYTNNSPRINDGNVIVSTHIYPGNFNQSRGGTYLASHMNDLAAIGKTVIVGEFGTGSGPCDWSGCVDFAKSRGWSVLAWAWNGDGGVLNMTSPAWAQQPGATSFSTNSYFNTLYPKLTGGGTTQPPPNPGTPVSAGTYSLRNRATGKMLDSLGVTTNGAGVGQWADGSSNNQRWVLSYTGGFARFMCVTGSKFLDSLGATADNSIVGMWDNSVSFNQQWTLTSLGGGFYRIVNRANGKSLDSGGGTADGAIMRFFPSSTSFNQQWQFVAP